MIQDILTTDRATETKPRFFLHDEVKQWLADNLEIRVKVIPNNMTDYSIIDALQKVNIYNPLAGGITIETSAYISGDPITPVHGSTVPMIAHAEVIYTLLKDKEYKEQLITNMSNQIDQLRRRIDLLENPLPA